MFILNAYVTNVPGFCFIYFNPIENYILQTDLLLFFPLMIFKDPSTAALTAQLCQL